MFILEKINGILWGVPGIVLLVGTGIFLTMVLRGLQFKRLIYAFKLAFGKEKESSGAEGDVSNFKALMTTLAGTIGNGNIAACGNGDYSRGTGRFVLDVARRPFRHGHQIQ